MRISEIDLQCEDIMWFAIDSKGNIFECTSAGCGNVPEYVCKSKEDTERILKYFMQEAPVITQAQLVIPADDSPLVADISLLASKGIYCFDITDYDKDDVYTCVAKPKSAISYDSLPQEIRNLLADHLYAGDVSVSTSIEVAHAY